MQKPWIVLKFGGTSVARAELWDHIADRAREPQPEPAAEVILDR